MEGEESLLDRLFEDDVEMVDVEEGEFVEDGLNNEIGLSGDGGAEGACDVIGSGNLKESATGISKSKRKKNRNKKKKNKSVSIPNVTDVNRFVLETCRRLKEKKSYMVYNAVGCLGVAALTEILKEIDAIQACGGQMTADGRRQRTGGGILWNILKTREPKAYKEIMNKSREFEKQFRPQSVGHALAPAPAPAPKGNNKTSLGVPQPRANHSPDTKPNDAPQIHEINGNLEQALLEGQPEQSKLEVADKPKPVHDRIRVPVRYDDLFEEAIYD